MDETARKLSHSIDAVSKALAEWTVTAHAELDPTLADRYGRDWRSKWVSDVQTRFRYLAQAIAVRRPRLFDESTAWSRSAFAAREVDPEDLSTSLQCAGEVVERWLPPAAAKDVLELIDLALATTSGSAPEESGYVGRDKPHGELTLKYLEAILDGRRNEAIELVLQAVETGTPVREIYSHVLYPAQAEVGRMWHHNEIGVADEHYATATTETAMSLLRQRRADGPRKAKRVVATAVEGDLHSLGVRMVAEFFEMDGWDTIYLGPNMPEHDLIQNLRDREAHLLALSVTSFLHLRAVGELIDAMQRSNGVKQVKVLVGGAPFNLVPDLWQELGADGWAPSAEAAVEVGNRLVNGAAGVGS
ncbi:MAG: cobalamin B12-binding domain-containing protein [Planctomycetota bacterium]|jgi:methanogenic corrinoid protein MtbC1